MRLVVWNCNMALHNKFQHLAALNPDVAIIPECGRIELIAERHNGFSPNSAIWVGDNPKKGLGILTFGSFTGTLDHAHRPDIPYFAPVRIQGSICFNLLGVWACHNKPTSYEADIGPMRRAIKAYQTFIQRGSAVVAGDFNNNVRWDRPHSKRNNHAMAVEGLEALDLKSAYHETRGIAQGNEPDPTLYWRDRQLNGWRYHIDYCFVPKQWIDATSVAVGTFEDWVARRLSDHVPLIIEVNEGLTSPTSEGR